MITTLRRVIFFKSPRRLFVTPITVAMGLLASAARVQNVFYESLPNTTQSFGAPGSWALHAAPGPAETAFLRLLALP